MILNDLFNLTLIKPALELGGNNLFIVSGYASPNMVSRHIEKLKELNLSINIKLIIGMVKSDGLVKSSHESIKKLCNEYSNFECHYLVHNYAVHSKVYSWFSDNNPLESYIGSANYTQNAFSNRQREVLTLSDPQKGRDYYYELLLDSIECRDSQVEDLIEIYERQYIVRNTSKQQSKLEVDSSIDLPKISVSLLDRKGNLPQRSGLNWGQRPEYNRDPNQAYLRLTSDIYKTDFFPPIGEHFTIITDDDKNIICARAQANGKAIHSIESNSRLGEYFRHRIGLPSGAPISTQDLKNYGRDFITFTKLDEETYLLDFSSNLTR
ncbi:hypothetical protein CH372_17330 [Leptospira meyeri]|uniref:restriction endonuclease PLD domain-containing protein n=1 Tax=Leptospira meyeri TaxID=29508 RepID=UPI000C298BAB|nr:restriction endonuclease PLD domain-containing protein [Leptospira meyeri]PKA10845.1 hypothetical protein CH372_17330 [Leptospira meyeri]PKA23965.1 hypothetical protein CH381_23190 [Leptospira sp. mixed culture ATI2-C-A1]